MSSASSIKHPEAIDIASLVTVDSTGNPDWTFPLHAHGDCMEISFVLSGKGIVYHDGQEVSISKGDVIIKNRDILHAERTNPNEFLRQICVSISGIREIENSPDHLISDGLNPVLHCGEDYEILAALFVYLSKNWSIEAARSKCKQVLLTVLEFIVERVGEGRAEQASGTRETRTAQAVDQAIDWINGHYREKITLQDLAERFYISPYYLEKKFNERVGFSINQYVIHRRMGEAQRLLIYSDKSIKEVAEAVGYDNLQYFYATFKKFTGKTPAAFQEGYRQALC